MSSEKKTDILIAELLKAAGIDYEPNGSRILEVQEALSTSSKRGTGKKGFPEYTAQVGDFILVIEDKKDIGKQAKYLDSKNEVLLMDASSIKDYAENGALHYAQCIVQKSSFKKVFAFGCSGTESGRLRIRPIFVSPNGYKMMRTVKDFKEFSADRIERYYDEKVRGNKPIEQVELEDIIRKAEKLHEDIRNYAPLRDSEKPLLVSAILLALCEPTFSTEKLNGELLVDNTDGNIIYNAIDTYMKRKEVEPGLKKDIVLNSFNLVKERTELFTHQSRARENTAQILCRVSRLQCAISHT